MKVEQLLDSLGTASHLAGGYNSEVFVITEGERFVAKVLGGERLSSTKRIVLTLEEARDLGMNIAEYAARLKAIGVVVPGHFSWAVVPGDNGASLVIFQSFVGSDDAKASLCAASNQQAVTKVIRAILAAIQPIFRPEVMGQVGIDPKPENFVFSDGHVEYVDFMPPRFRQGQRALVEYPEPTTNQGYELGLWKHFTPEGILTILLTQLTRIRPEYFPLFLEEIENWLGSNGSWVAEVRHSLRTWILPSHDRDVAASAIERAANPYQLRLVACQMAFPGGCLNDGGLEQLFRMSHYEDGDFTTVLAAAKGVALTALRSS